MRPPDRQRIVLDVVQRVVGRYVDEAATGPAGSLAALINDTLYHEGQRLKLEKPQASRTRNDRAHYQAIKRQLHSTPSAALPEILEALATHFVAEIVGNFDERVYRLSTWLVPRSLSVLLSATSPLRFFTLQRRARPLAEHIRVEGAVDQVCALAQKGTLIVAPTHCSHLDSPVMAWAIYAIGLRPLLYGAGLNLFTNPLLSFFMSNLGAYRIDRKKKARLYIDLVKAYATCAAEYGYSQLFFPGGTRSRSGALEQQLKKGLLGTALRAYIHNLQQEKTLPQLYIVPCTVSYNLVPEAETLIGDTLKRLGHARYIIDDDELAEPRRMWSFFRRLLAFDDQIVVRFGEPLDVVGNRVDGDGCSLDPCGRRVDTASYVMQAGRPVVDDQRDAEYTTELARALADRYRANNVIRPTQLVGRALMRMLRQHNSDLDLVRLLHTGGGEASFPVDDVHLQTGRLLAEVKALRGGPRCDALLATGDVAAIVAEALKRYGIYHKRPAAFLDGTRVHHEDRSLLFYYSNRLNGYGLDQQG